MFETQFSQFNTCSASTTASKSHTRDFFNGDVICDWLKFRHDFAIEKPTLAIASGKTLKINKDGEKEWESDDFTTIHCHSSDTSVRIKCDGAHLWFSGNIGRFGEPDNETGLTVLHCFEKAVNLIRTIYPQLNLKDLGTIQREGTISEYGTYLTRLDLASNFETDNYHLLNQTMLQRRINRKTPKDGKYGATWGYDSKRAQYWKAKLYDKLAELLGKRTPHTGKTTARFEVQLGSEFLRQEDLNKLKHWGLNMKTENIIYGHFASQILRENATVETWQHLPTRLRQHAIMWRDGVNPKTYLSKSQYHKTRNQLLEYGIDIACECNVMTLLSNVRYINLKSLPTLRKVA